MAFKGWRSKKPTFLALLVVAVTHSLSTMTGVRVAFLALSIQGILITQRNL
jgi:hypothetical protein